MVITSFPNVYIHDIIYRISQCWASTNRDTPLLIGTVFQVFPHRTNYSCEEVSVCDGSLLSPKTPEQAVENAGAAGWMLSDDDWRRLDRLGWETSQRIIYVTW